MPSFQTILGFMEPLRGLWDSQDEPKTCRSQVSTTKKCKIFWRAGRPVLSASGAVRRGSPVGTWASCAQGRRKAL